MRLFGKIYLQVFLGILIISQATFAYFFLSFQKQRLEELAAYEGSQFDERVRQIGRKVEELNLAKESREIQDMAVIQVFREALGSAGGLCRGEEEIYNNSPYDFEYSKIRNKIGQNYGKSEIVSLDGEKLMLFQRDFCIKKPENLYYIVYYKNVTEVYEWTKRFFFQGFGITMGMLLLTGGVLFQSIYRTLRPIMELKKAAASIAGGAYHIRIKAKGKDEISALTENFNQMAECVEEHIEKLSHQNEAQRQLLGSLAHELKTPMTALIGYADTLLTVRLSDKRREEALSYIGNECRRLSRLSRKLMELTGMYESAEVSGQREERFEELLAKLKALTEYRLGEKNICLKVECEPKEASRMMDEDLMMSLLMNLVDNSFKASKEGSSILVKAWKDGISVEDSGKGIPKEELGRVTEAFYMVDKARARSQGSVGLGLALCRRIAKLHGARLVIESEEGKGTKVSVLW